MSKKTKLGIAILAILGISGWAGYMLWPKKSSSLVEKEVTIKQAGISEAKNVKHENWAGFSFEYPESLKLQEIEADDKKVYASLELTAADNQKLTLRISDSSYQNLEEWQKVFEEKNVAISMRDIYWVDIAGVQLYYGAPKKMLTVAWEDGVLYELESPSGGFWEETHRLVLNSFEFDESVMVMKEEEAATAGTKSETDEGIVLLEEEVTE